MMDRVSRSPRLADQTKKYQYLCVFLTIEVATVQSRTAFCQWIFKGPFLEILKGTRSVRQVARTGWASEGNVGSRARIALVPRRWQALLAALEKADSPRSGAVLH